MKLSSPVHSPTEIYDKLHDYNISSQITNYGLYSQIHTAYHRIHRIPLAVKIISKNRIADLPKKERILFNETILSPLLDHPNIIHVEEIIENNSKIFQFMQFAEKGDLLHSLQKCPPDQKTCFKYVEQLLAAVERIHSLGIVHRDIKLENILITSNDVLKLSDFGLASITCDGIMKDNCGSYEYSAPEAISHAEFDGFKADMWGVGIIIYALFQKRLPFEDVRMGYNYNKPVDFSRIPDPLQELCKKLLSLDPNERPSADEARRMLGHTHTVPVFSALAQDPRTFDQFTASKLCQTIGLPINEIRADIQSDEFSEIKVLAVLINQRNLILRPASRSVSEPAHRPTQLYASRLKADGCDVMQAIRDYLLPKRCLISSPLSDTPEIVLNGKYADKRVSFTCNDSPDGYCSIEMYPDEGSDDVCKSVIHHLEKSFFVV
ncbi:CAMK family protein kinase [Trichomonas vaginalis G3]|uniref:CAMK family protein kinase n=1 Tax=Trichomonas vaginalis (strain ATCC PRA-98 / G3) TaxID=412133 RepID=A2ES55_TRIV3|nr:protein serine/threonine kinase protein [Trichomonas vaginalis G3]EAY04492.1 CAMK family protein kinase [Trichomonas vaginalis G3]KAI5503283.1 protein serine/threonine kinase protein [Trichomonas vaginalis G3]|eukprot:XP_001316715.1 CAMK family protein kinase [Trichomonas vaginalis G3]